MSHLPPQAITEFQALWKKHYGTELPAEEAAVRANEVFAVLRLVLTKPRHRPISNPPTIAVPPWTPNE